MTDRVFEIISIEEVAFPGEITEFNGVECSVLSRDRTATIKMTANTGQTTTYELGYITPKEIYKTIHEKGEINLNKTLVVDFSIDDLFNEYPDLLNEDVILYNFQAAKSIWIKDKKDIKFDNCIFMNTDDSDIHGASFFDIKANAEISFSGCKFYVPLVDFCAMETDHNLYFNEAYFDGNVDISQTTIGGLSFVSAEFNEGFFDLYDVTIMGYEFDFILTNFAKTTVILNKIAIHSDIEWRWWGVKSDGLVLFINSFFYGNIELEFEMCRELCLQHCFNASALLISIKDEKKVERLSFHKTTSSGMIYIDSKELVSRLDRSREYIATSEISHVFSTKEIKSRDKANQYILLKENYSKIGYYELEDHCYKNLRRHLRRSKKNKLVQFCEWLFQDILGHYGTSWMSILLAIPIMIVLWGFLFYLLPGVGFSPVKDIWNAIYVSGITFFTIGFGDITPVNTLSQLLCIVEGFNGVFLVSYFTICFARKTIR